MAIKIIKKPIIFEDIESGLGTTIQERDVNGTGLEEVTYNKVRAEHIPTEGGANVQAELDGIYTKTEADSTFALLAGETTQLFSVADATLSTHAVNKSFMDAALITKAAEYALKTNVLQKDNLISYTPTSDYHPATKKYIDDTVITAGAGDMLKTVYDSVDDGVVNNSRLLEGQALSGMLSNKGVVTDCDLATTIGSWEGENVTHAPETGKGILVVNDGATKGIILQMYAATPTATIYFRVYSGTAWSSWESQSAEVSVEDSLTSSSAVDALSANQGRVLSEQLSTASNTNVPIGGIIMYDGLFSNVPSNWSVCDGDNGTPNLSDRFIRGTEAEADIGNTGGSDDASMPDHSHTGPNHYHTGPSHTHSGPNHNHSGPSHTHSIYHNHGAATTSSHGNHNHTYLKPDLVVNYARGDEPNALWNITKNSLLTTNTSYTGAHTHTFDVPSYSGNSGSGGTNDTGYNGTGNTSADGTGHTGNAGTGETGIASSGSSDNKPLYYVLAYIKRIS